ncbi:MAG: phenylacetate-CoA oxygenase subunit PaaJ [Actinomycetota bacterium]|nr:phenylacetate-CoA oxygenase subunit PaaJ [Actinomycetota bacterium]
MVTRSTETIERHVERALGEIRDPEIPACSITDLGMVERVSASDDVIEVDLLPTFVGCPAKDIIGRDVRAGLTDVAGDREVRVRFVYDPPWTTDRITERGRARLREVGIAPEWEGGPPMSAGPVSIMLMEPSIMACPFCGSEDTVRESAWSPTPCRTQHFCRSCRNPFEGFKEKALL